jgi:hypothetical protein
MLPDKVPFEAFTAEEYNKLLDLIETAYDSGVANDQNQKTLTLNWKVISDEYVDVLGMQISTPNRLSGYPLNMLISFTIDGVSNDQTSAVTVLENGEVIDAEVFSDESNNTMVYISFEEKGFYNIKIRMNSFQNTCLFKTVSWGW